MAAAQQIVVHTVIHSNDLAPTVVGAAGILLALGSLAWQSFTFFRSGSRVSVVFRAGVTDGVRVVTVEGTPSDDQIKMLQSQGLSQLVYGVEVINSGRGPTSVMAVSVLFDNGAVYSGAYLAGSPELPFRIDGESEKSWYIDAGTVQNAVKAFEKVKPTGTPQCIRGQIKLGGKKPVVSKNKIRVL